LRALSGRNPTADADARPGAKARSIILDLSGLTPRERGAITTIITFLLVVLLQNAQRRSETALHHKLNATTGLRADLRAAAGLGENV
jgi:hypothetical protein